MKQVYAPANGAEAHMVVHLLAQEGIEAHIHGEALQGGVGELPAGGLLQILVADDDYGAARTAILAWERASAGPETAPVRPRFPTVLVAVAFAVGLIGGWIAKATSVSVPIDTAQVEMDQNNDGLTDFTYFYRLGGTYAYKSEADNNADGRPDQIYYFDNAGATTRGESDLDFDGFRETRSVYEGGMLKRQELDLNGNREPDIVTFYRNGVATREQITDESVGRVASVSYFGSFMRESSEHDLDRDGVMETTRAYDRFGEIVSTQTDAAAQP